MNLNYTADKQSKFYCSAIRLLILLCLSLPAFSASQIEFTPEEKLFINTHPNILVGAETDWAPLDYMHNGQYTGLANDYLELISERTGLNFEIISGFTWNELLTMQLNQRLDLLPAIYWSPQRDQLMHYTSSYIKLRHYAFTKSDREDIKSMQDLQGKTIAIPTGFSYLDTLKKTHPNITILEVKSTLEAIDAVITGQADTLVESTTIINYYLNENHIYGLKPAFAAEFDVDQVYMAARSGLPILATIINKVLESITPEEKKQLTDRWVNVPMTLKQGQTSNLLTIEELRYLQQKKMIKTCIDPNWLPYEGFIDGKFTGMSAEYIAYFSEQIGIPIDVVKTDTWEQSLKAVRLRDCDMLALASNRPERRKYLSFTIPYLKTSLALATQKEEWFYSNFSELEGKKIGIIKGYSPGKVIKKRHPKINFTEFNSISEGLKSVNQGKILGFLDSVPTLSYHIQTGFIGELKISGKFDYDWNSGIAARNDEPHLVTIFNKVIQATPDSVHNRIRGNWLGVRYEESIDYRLIWQLLFGFAVILTLVILRYRQLSKHRNAITDKNTELAQINEQLETQKQAAQHVASHDILTGLPNRSQLLLRLEHAIDLAARQGSQIAVFFIDLDRFKYINDSFGHHFGDALLCQVGNQMLARLRSSDTLARIGGDEFVVILETFDDEEATALIAQELIDIIQHPYNVMGHVVNISASLGISVYPNDSKDVHTLIKYADIAMYRAKELGRNRFRYYTQSLSERTDKRLRTDTALREALGLGQFSLHFQPIIDLNSCTVSHAEALIRWNHPEMGMVPPDYFIPIAEENGLIHELGLWVLSEACRCYKEWKANGLDLNRISINVSSIQFQKGNLTETFKRILQEEGIEAQRIDIEITERYLMDQTERNIHYLNTLKKSGHTITVDDFGVGYSSMSYMKRLPLDIIKIDRSFISDIPEDRNDIQISQAIISLSHNLGYKATAEGVEIVEQFNFLREAHCDYAQGYYFSPPVPAHQFIECVKQLNTRLMGETPPFNIDK
ncbi:EAL domain-containing protein [Neptuniibacter sp. 2_MG-2023]|uniref:EAL domain-containing protein n=1 Tax=Neptuniibacter sp. 2_MG-2023 TaxID=3062671 RepID=UPI0026E402F5|nr:EAL domain-containing protein [Neptuniibacter sp. 2_MG-2023]MDO6515069.1 EAL domain-containing protein [Neptuniibacter sp. 2_MG-2023]